MGEIHVFVTLTVTTLCLCTVDVALVIGWLVDTTQLAKQMTKDTRDTSHFDQSSQYTRQRSTKYRKDLSRRRIGHKLEHQMFFLIVFLQDKMFVNKSGSLWGFQIEE